MMNYNQIEFQIYKSCIENCTVTTIPNVLLRKLHKVTVFIRHKPLSSPFSFSLGDFLMNGTHVTLCFFGRPLTINFWSPSLRHFCWHCYWCNFSFSRLSMKIIQVLNMCMAATWYISSWSYFREKYTFWAWMIWGLIMMQFVAIVVITIDYCGTVSNTVSLSVCSCNSSSPIGNTFYAELSELK